MIVIDDILTKKYVLAFDNNSFYSRYIIKIANVELKESSETREEYALTSCDKHVYKLYHNIISGRLTIDIGFKNLLTIEQCTNNFIEILQEGDTLIYYQSNSPPIQVKVVKYQEKYRRFIMECRGTRHNLTTILSKYGTANIVAIHTADYVERRRKEFAKAI